MRSAVRQTLHGLAFSTTLNPTHAVVMVVVAQLVVVDVVVLIDL